MVLIADIETSINKGYEEIASLQLTIAKRSRVSGDVNIYNRPHMLSLKLYAFIDALTSIPFNHTMEQNEVVERLHNNIKQITKDLRQWN